MQRKRKKPYVYEDFMNSALYIGFCRYGRHLDKLNAIDPSGYTDFLIKHGVGLSDWIKDYPYETFIKEVIVNEGPNCGVERTLKYLDQWAEDNNSPLVKFFAEVNTNQALNWIITGRISPWILFCSSTSNKLLERMTPEQLGFVNDFVEPARWKVKLKQKHNEVNSIRKILEKVGL